MTKSKKIFFIVSNVILILAMLFFSIFITPYADDFATNGKVVSYDTLDVLKVVWILILSVISVMLYLWRSKKYCLIWYIILAVYAVGKTVSLFLIR